MNLLDANVKSLSFTQMKCLCAQIRRFLLSHVSQTGGHLASSLGAVEIIVSLHKVFDTAADRVIFDVGHQAYAHKILTGRRDGFDTLRQWGSVSGFPQPEESVHDAFVAGHASTSISVALGMARAERLTGGKARCIAVLGDGALTGGMAYEAINDLGQSGEPVIVVLNDNGMSIDKNVGGIAKHLARLRTRPQYFKLKRAYHRVTDPLPGGRAMNRALHRMKTTMRDAILPDSSLFESMGFLYLGPGDGHSIEEIVNLLEYAKAANRPTLIHLRTTKGKGYKAAENNPRAFHGVSAFNLQNGRSACQRSECFSDRFGATLLTAAENDARIVAITAAMPDGTGLRPFAKQLPTRFFDVGIAEAHAVTMAAAMAKQGLKPVVALYSSFLQRAYDSLVHDVALGKLPVVLCVDRAGLVGEDGATHQGLLDVGFLSQIPNISLYAPASLAELSSMLTLALQANDGPVAIRYPRGGEDGYSADNSGDDFVRLREGGDAALVTYGTMTPIVLQVADALAGKGCAVSVLKLNRLSPLPVDEILSGLPTRCAVVEEVVANGSVGQHLAAASAQRGDGRVVTLCNAGQRFVPHGSVADQRRFLGLDVESLTRALGERWV